MAGFVLLHAAGVLGAGELALERAVPRQLTPEEIAALPRGGSHVILQPVAFDPMRSAPDFTAVGLPETAAGQYGLVQFAPGALAEKERLEKLGVRFFGYIPDNAFQVKLTPTASKLLSGNPAVRWFGAYAPGFKVSPRLWASSKDPNIEVTVQLFADASLDEVEKALSDAFPDSVRTLRREDDTWPMLRFAVPDSARASFVAYAAALDGTAWLEPRSPLILLNNDSLGPIQSNTLTVLGPGGTCTSCGIFNHGITGTGQIAAVADSGLDDDMCFFRYSASPTDVTDAETTVPPQIGTLFPGKKVIGYWIQPGATAYDNDVACAPNPPTSFHGTHTTGTVAGDNFATLSTATSPGIDPGDGMAPNAKILFQDIGNDTTGCLEGGDPYQMFQQASAGGARIHSNSYGEGSPGSYDSYDQELDRFLFDHEEMALFFAAGNSGNKAMTIESPANSKSVISVGALGHGNAETTAGFSSRGPTTDGRVKPDVMAPGQNVLSAFGDASHTTNNCSTQSLSGTSMATPTAAGGSVLLRQYFADGFYPTGVAVAANSLEASAPLVKAVLLNGTLPLGGSFGDSAFGWGRVFLDNNLYFAGDARSLRIWNLSNAQGLTSGESRSFTVKVGAGQEFRATLVWFDPEGTPGAGVVLVNNLDLSVSDGTNTYLGNVFDATGASITGGSADQVNTVEHVRLPTPAAGTYTVTVSAPKVPGNGRPYTNRQGFALVVSAARCATAVGAAPTSVAVSASAVMGAVLSWAPAPNSTGTQVYRANADCSASSGSFQYVGSSTGTFFTDTRAEGGSTYAYRVRGVDDCGEGPVSACVSVTATGRCDLIPTFAGIVSAAPAGTTCAIHLTWGSGTAGCPLGSAIRYNVYRSTVPNFTPSLANWVATTTGLSIDDESVESGTTYYYLVRAEDSTAGGPGPNGGNEDGNVVQIFATADGPPGAFGTWTDDGGDTVARLHADPPWQVSHRQAQAGGHSYHSGPEAGTYPPNTCAAVTTPALVLSTGSVLSYWASFNLEFQWDGVVVEISADGGTTWSTLAPAAGYPDKLSQTQGNGCNYPATQDAFTGPSGNASLTPWTQYTSNLSPTYDNKTVQIRWRFTSDPGAEFDGFYLDTISVTNVRLPGFCLPLPPAVSQAPITRPKARGGPPHLAPRTP